MRSSCRHYTRHSRSKIQLCCSVWLPLQARCGTMLLLWCCHLHICCIMQWLVAPVHPMWCIAIGSIRLSDQAARSGGGLGFSAVRQRIEELVHVGASSGGGVLIQGIALWVSKGVGKGSSVSSLCTTSQATHRWFVGSK